MDNLRNLLCSWLGCQTDCSAEQSQLTACLTQTADLQGVIETQAEQIRQLQLLVPRPPPTPLDYTVELDTAWVDAQLSALKLNIVRLPLDGKYRLTNRKNFANIVAYDTTERLVYVRDFFDCDKFAMMFKVMTNLIFNVNQVAYILDYKSGHSYNLVLFAESEPMVLEPQSDGMWMWTQRLDRFYSLEGAFALI